jgi:MoxR-like ATPase
MPSTENNLRAPPMRKQKSKRVGARPFYLPIADELEIFRAAYEQHLPVLLKGPTGCGKTRFVEHMTWSVAISYVATRPCGWTGR